MKIIANNPKAAYDYHLFTHFDAGLVLSGLEIKAIRDKGVSIAEAWIQVRDGRVLLMDANITPKNSADWELTSYKPNGTRVVLLRKKEIVSLERELLSGRTAVPLRVYLNDHGFAKLVIATAKGKKQHDKRETTRAHDLQRYGFEN